MEDDFTENFAKKQDELMYLEQDADQDAFSPEILLERFYSVLDDMALNPDLLPITAEAYRRIIKKQSPDAFIHSFQYMLENYETVISRDSLLITDIIKTFPQFGGILFDILANRSVKGDTKWCATTLLNIISLSPQQDAFAMIAKLYKLPKPVQNYLSSVHFNRVYKARPDLQAELFRTMVQYTDGSDADEICRLLDFLDNVIQINPNKAQECLDIAKQYITLVSGDKRILYRLTNFLGTLYKIPEYTATATDFLNTLKPYCQEPSQQRDIARILGEQEPLRSSVRFGRRIAKSQENQYGWTWADTIPLDEPCVLVFGGTGADSPKSINGYMSAVETLLKNSGTDMTKVGIYGIVYDFGDAQTKDCLFYDATARVLEMIKYKRVKESDPRIEQTLKFQNTETENPRYIQQLFDRVFLPRISQNGERLPLDVALKNIRNITIVAHCHGGYTFLRIEELMQEKMRELGYAPEERDFIQKQLICIAHAPFCPLGVSKSTMISFISEKDSHVSYYNNFATAGHMIDFDFSWFPGRQGNMFVTPEISTDEYSDDHKFLSYDITPETLSQNGKILIKFAGNTIVNSVRNAMAGGLVPSVEDLVTGGDENTARYFRMAKINGEKMYAKILKRIHEMARKN